MKKRIFLHIGAHKTATTLIQTSVLTSENLDRQKDSNTIFISAHNPVHKYLDFRLPYTNTRNNILWSIIRGEELSDVITRRMITLIQGYIETVREEKIVWSDENLLGGTPGHPVGQIRELTAGLYPASECIARLFSQALSDHDVYVRLYTRNIASLLRSSYADWIAKLREPTAFEEFSDKLMSGSTKWGKVTEGWQRYFGERFTTVAYESISDGKHNFLRDFSNWAEIDFDDTRMSAKTASNRGLSERQIQLALLNIPHIGEEERPAFLKFLRSVQ